MLSIHFIKRGILFFLYAIVATVATAQIKLPLCFSDNMVLQRDKPIPIWGKATPGEKVNVTFAGKLKSAITDTTGKWIITLDKTPASAKPSELTVSSSSVITFKNILVGDVWLCGGQSNMEYPMDRLLKKYAAPGKGADSAAIELANPDKPDAIRYLYVEKNLKVKPELPTKGWIGNTDTMVRYISAIGYFFAKEIHAETGIPIGIIHDNWGGTRIEPWTPDWAYQQSPVFAAQSHDANFKIDSVHPGQMYNSLIEPLVPYAIKGVLWYQGESNAMIDDQATYNDKFKTLIGAWRKEFKDEKMPFYYVQISPHSYTKRKTDKPIKSAESLPLAWEAQAAGLKISNTGMIVTTDLVDNLGDIHPSYKWTVAHRLALIAKAKTYGKKITEYSGPVYQSMKVGKENITLTFTHTGSGLISSDGQPLNWFTIAGADSVFVPATAIIRGNTIVVSASNLINPKHVRFAWNEAAQPNFFNKEGLPAQPFRTKF
jgi:sialate O-acetylesterase